MHERTQIKLSATDRAALKAVVANRNSPQKHVWRAKIVLLLTAAGHGTAEIMRRTGKAKTVIWHWQERFGSEGAAGLWRDKTRPSRIPPLSPDIAERVVALTLAGKCMKRHRHQEFIRFLNLIDARVPTQLIVHVIVDNYAAHKHPKVLEWLARHPRFVFHFTPTSASWLNAVEGLFALLAKRRLKRGVFRSLKELTDAIHSFIADTNANPKPFIWTKDPGKIIAAVKRGHQALNSIH